MLADARAARGVTLKQVSASTKIPVATLQAIERDEIEGLPGGIFIRGFVRSYADAVGLDPQATLARFEARFPEESSVATLLATIEGRANEEFARRQRTVKGLLWIAVLSAPLVVWLAGAVLPDDRRPAAAGGETPPPGASQGALAPSAAAPVELSAVEADALPAAPAVSAAGGSAPVVAGARASAPVAAGVRGVSPVDAARLTVVMSATADCWVQVQADGETVLSRILRPGEREVVAAERAIDLRVGNAGAFVFTINQRPGRSLGALGEVVSMRVTPSNYRSFAAE